MSTKKVSFGTRPTHQTGTAADPDSWVTSRQPSSEKLPMKRLTVDLPADLHARVKAQCALRGMKISDEIRAMLEEKFKT